MILFILFVLFICLYIYIAHKLTFWSSQKIPNEILYRVNSFKRVVAFSDYECVQKYGKIYGTYELLRPVLTVADSDLINKVLKSNFKCFPNRMDIILPEKIMGESLFFHKYHEWKPMRTVIVPTFTTANMKKMYPVFENSANIMSKQMENFADNGILFDVKQVIEYSLMDIIFKTFFGVEIDSAKDPNNIYVKNSRAIMNHNLPLSMMPSLLWPKMSRYFNNGFTDRSCYKFFSNLSHKLIEKRKSEQTVKNDFIQYLLNAENEHNSKSNKSKNTLTVKEIIDNCILFFIGGFDTTSSGLVHLIYGLTINQNCQTKLIEEIDECTKLNVPLTEVLHKMTYLDACVNEILRLYPPLSRIERISTEETYLGDIFVPKNSVISIPIYSVHRDPDNFENPHEFLPERFFAENKHKIKSGTYIPFADGPRNCLGNRFAIMEIKIIILTLMKKYRFIECDQMNENDYYTGYGIFQAKRLNIKIEKRE